MKGLTYASMLMKGELVVSECNVGGCFETDDGGVCGEKMKKTYNARRRRKRVGEGCECGGREVWCCKTVGGYSGQMRRMEEK